MLWGQSLTMGPWKMPTLAESPRNSSWPVTGLLSSCVGASPSSPSPQGSLHCMHCSPLHHKLSHLPASSCTGVTNTAPLSHGSTGILRSDSKLMHRSHCHKGQRFCHMPPTVECHSDSMNVYTRALRLQSYTHAQNSSSTSSSSGALWCNKF